MPLRSTAVWLSLALMPGEPARAQGSPSCLPDNAGLALPQGFCALIVADSVGAARHIAVAPNGDIFIALSGSAGGVLALRDADGDGVAELRERFGPGRGGSGIALRGGYLYFAPNDVVVRYRLGAGTLQPASPPDTIVKGLPSGRSHSA